MKDKDFVEISAQLRQQEKQMLSSALFRRAAESGSLQTALSLLTQGAYDFSQIHGVEEADLLLRSQTEEAYQWMYEHIPHKEIVDVLAIRYQFDNLKTALYTHFAFASLPPIYPYIGDVEPDEYAAFFVHQDPFESKLPDYLLKPAQNALKVIADGGTPAGAQQDFPRQMYHYMLALAAKIGSSFITDIVKMMIDFHNALALVQVRWEQKELDSLEPQLIEGGSTSTSYFLTGYTRELAAAIPAVYHKEHGEAIADAVAQYERTGDLPIFHHLFRHLQQSVVDKADLIDYGPEVPFAHLLKQEYEISQIRAILYGLEEKRPDSQILLFLGLEA